MLSSIVIHLNIITNYRRPPKYTSWSIAMCDISDYLFIFVTF